jgi:hypothetical protein
LGLINRCQTPLSHLHLTGISNFKNNFPLFIKFISGFMVKNCLTVIAYELKPDRYTVLLNGFAGFKKDLQIM